MAQVLRCDGLCEIRSAMGSAKSTPRWVLQNPLCDCIRKPCVALISDEQFLGIRCALNSPQQKRTTQPCHSQHVRYYAHLGFCIWFVVARWIRNFWVRSDRCFACTLDRCALKPAKPVLRWIPQNPGCDEFCKICPARILQNPFHVRGPKEGEQVRWGEGVRAGPLPLPHMPVLCIPPPPIIKKDIATHVSMHARLLKGRGVTWEVFLGQQGRTSVNNMFSRVSLTVYAMHVVEKIS